MYFQNDLHNHHPEKMRRSMWIWCVQTLSKETKAKLKAM